MPNNVPLAMKALLNLLVLLDDQEIIKVVREWDASKVVVSVTTNQ